MLGLKENLFDGATSVEQNVKNTDLADAKKSDG